jgi:hypothetical protein
MAEKTKKNNDADKVLKFLTDNKGTSYSRADIEAKTKVANASGVLRDLRTLDKVVTQGEKRGMKYAAK